MLATAQKRSYPTIQLSELGMLLLIMIDQFGSIQFFLLQAAQILFAAHFLYGEPYYRSENERIKFVGRKRAAEFSGHRRQMA